MFNTMTITKTAGALIGSLLALLLLFWLGSTLFHVGPPGGHGDEEIAQAYAIEVASAEDAAEEEPEEEVDFEVVLASADPARGERAFGKCRSCHKVDGTDGVGPHLDGVVGREKAAVAGYAYSDAALSQDGSWTPENLDAFIADPKGYMPGTKMSFAGIRAGQERADLIAWLSEQ